jgi:hypothetical protein
VFGLWRSQWLAANFAWWAVQRKPMVQDRVVVSLREASDAFIRDKNRSKTLCYRIRGVLGMINLWHLQGTHCEAKKIRYLRKFGLIKHRQLLSTTPTPQLLHILVSAS